MGKYFLKWFCIPFCATIFVWMFFNWLFTVDSGWKLILLFVIACVLTGGQSSGGNIPRPRGPRSGGRE